MLNYNLKNYTSRALQDLFYRYTHLPIGGKEIVCPYWMNNLKLGIFGPYGGKGTPEQIVEATNTEARREGIDLVKMSEVGVLDFMRERKIGIDCSGFVFWMLDTLDREKGGNGIADDIPESAGRFLPARTNVRMLTDEQITLPVELKDIQVGDMLRMNEGKHVAIVTRVVRDLEGVREIEYAHSSEKTKISGVHRAKIQIFDQNKGLESQQWEEGIDDGIIKRLRIWVSPWKLTFPLQEE